MKFILAVVAMLVVGQRVAADVGRLAFHGTECTNGVCRRVIDVGTGFSVGRHGSRSIWIGPGHGAFRVGDRVDVLLYDSGKRTTGTVLFKEMSGQADISVIMVKARTRWDYKLRRPVVGQTVRVFGYPNGVDRRHSFVAPIVRSRMRNWPMRVGAPGELASGYSGGPLSVTTSGGIQFCLGVVWGGNGAFTPADRIVPRLRRITAQLTRVTFAGQPSPSVGTECQSCQQPSHQIPHTLPVETLPVESLPHGGLPIPGPDCCAELLDRIERIEAQLESGPTAQPVSGQSLSLRDVLILKALSGVDENEDRLIGIESRNTYRPHTTPTRIDTGQARPVSEVAPEPPTEWTRVPRKAEQ